MSSTLCLRTLQTHSQILTTRKLEWFSHVKRINTENIRAVVEIGEEPYRNITFEMIEHRQKRHERMEHQEECAADKNAMKISL